MAPMGATGEMLNELELLFEVLRLMAGDVVERPCRYPRHAATVWWNEAGRPVCGICHPSAR